MRHRLLCGMLAAVSIVAVSEAVGDPTAADKAKQRTAKSYVEAGREAQNSRDYETAILFYRKAYELIPHPVLLFNMAQVHRLAGRWIEAIALYQRYLQVDPQGAETRVARAMIAELEAQHAPNSDASAAPDRTQANRNNLDGVALVDQGTPATTAVASDPPTAPAASPALAPTAVASNPSTAPAASPARDTPIAPALPVEHAERVAQIEGPASSPVSEAPAVKHDAHPTDASLRAGTPDRGQDAEAARPQLLRFDFGTSVAEHELRFANVSDLYLNSSEIAIRLNGEISFTNLMHLHGQLGNIGLVFEYDRRLGGSIDCRGNSTSVNQWHGQIGPRLYTRLGDASTFVVGIDYARRKYDIEHDAAGAMCVDVPEVDYASIGPVMRIQVPIAVTVATFAGLHAMWVFDTGQQDGEFFSEDSRYKASAVSAWGVEGIGGVDVAVSRRIHVRMAIEYSWIALSFTGFPVEATDRSIGAVATVGFAY